MYGKPSTDALFRTQFYPKLRPYFTSADDRFRGTCTLSCARRRTGQRNAHEASRLRREGPVPFLAGVVCTDRTGRPPSRRWSGRGLSSLPRVPSVLTRGDALSAAV